MAKFFFSSSRHSEKGSLAFGCIGKYPKIIHPKILWDKKTSKKCAPICELQTNNIHSVAGTVFVCGMKAGFEKCLFMIHTSQTLALRNKPWPVWGFEGVTGVLVSQSVHPLCTLTGSSLQQSVTILFSLLFFFKFKWRIHIAPQVSNKNKVEQTNNKPKPRWSSILQRHCTL